MIQRLFRCNNVSTPSRVFDLERHARPAGGPTLPKISPTEESCAIFCGNRPGRFQGPCVSSAL
jgi:hypothetical protein